MIATGARARRLRRPAPAGVHVLRTLDDALALRAELLPGARLGGDRRRIHRRRDRVDRPQARASR